eukprot:TRINITY_DN19671_c0_g1_i1.p1 TRINITY_DN19671_c0_g1~~TRINITY_DN19671_c0_g1_i1.p1  ORF type:complete len:438 (+),score=88.19 TRINITY_DN19671_c0_g1_i1:38-1315(+)
MEVAHAAALASADAAKSSSTPEELKELGNEAFRKAKLMMKTTAGKQYAVDARQRYIDALVKLGPSAEPKRPEGGAAPSTSQELAAALYSNLAAVFLLEARGCGRTREDGWKAAPEWERAFTSADSALKIKPRLPKALFRRAQARLEDEREGLPESQLRSAVADFKAALKLEPNNKDVASEAARIERRLAAAEAARKIPEPAAIVGRINPVLLERGGDCLQTHGYVWGQTDTVVHVFVPARGERLIGSAAGGSCGVSGKANKKIICDIHANSLRIELPMTGNSSQAGELSETFKLVGKLHRHCRSDESEWQLEDNGLILHVELAKREDSEEEGGAEKHWQCVIAGHPQTLAKHPDLQRHLDEAQKAAQLREQEEQKAPKDPAAEAKKAEVVKRMQEMFPGVPCEWGDTSIGGLRTSGVEPFELGVK